MKAFPLALPLVTGLLATASFAETVKDREGAVRSDRAAMEKDARWIYNDFQRGFAEARRTGKPLLVVLRCVPCLSCMGIDASVLTKPELAPRLDQFVCVRVINANALALFVKSVGQYGKHAAAKNAGFQKDDVIVELDGASARTTESEVIARLLEKHRPGGKAKAVVLRGTQRVELTLPMQ